MRFRTTICLLSIAAALVVTARANQTRPGAAQDPTAAVALFEAVRQIGL